MMNPPDDAMEIKAIARMWKFQFVYENGKVTDTLYVPVNQPMSFSTWLPWMLSTVFISRPSGLKRIWYPD